MNIDSIEAHQISFLSQDQTLVTLFELLGENLDFHNFDSTFASHNFHSFPAKFPPQLPQFFIENLTEENEIVLDPMMGSGTTIVEAISLNRKALGFDIDPLALLISLVKAEYQDFKEYETIGYQIIDNAQNRIKNNSKQIEEELAHYFNKKTKIFVDYWFAEETQNELFALISEINAINNRKAKNFFELLFSSIIITKSGGVSMAFDLAHTRPHRAKIVYGRNGNILLGEDRIASSTKRDKFLTKILASPIDEFNNKLQKIILKGSLSETKGELICTCADSQSLPLPDSCIDLIVTSPPYAANAIDYMRAHKFSLVWLNHDLELLSKKRSEYIGSESINSFNFETFPSLCCTVIDEVKNIDKNRASVLARYYSEMTRVLKEMHRVLRPGKAAILVVGNSIMRGVDTRTEVCLAEIGKALGFSVPRIGVRNLDRNRRMMPIGNKKDLDSQIQQRMYEEYVIGFVKP